MQDYSDIELITKYLGGDEKSLELLIQRYLKPVYGFVYRYSGNTQNAEDITQDVFIKIWRNLKKFDQSKRFKTWIFSIAKNTAIDFLKKKKAIPFSEFENEEGENMLLETLADKAELAPEILEKRGVGQMLKSVISKLSKKYQDVLSLRYHDNFTFREISEALEEPLNTVKSRHRRALIILKNIVNQTLLMHQTI